MKQTPLERKTPLKAKTPLKTTSTLKPKKKAKKSRLQAKKDNPRSVYWRNKADSEVSQFYKQQACAVCGSEDMVCGHHIIPKSRSAIHRHSPQNLIPLCPKHHTFGNDICAHGQNGLAIVRWWEWFQEHKPEQYEWVKAHEHEIGKPNYQEAYEYWVEVNKQETEYQKLYNFFLRNGGQ